MALLCFMNAWELEQAHRVGREVQRLRKLPDRNWSAQQLAERTDKLGLKMTRQAISDLENGRRRYITTAELIVLAAALNTSPVALAYPGPYNQQVEILPGKETTEYDAAQWFSGNGYWRLIQPADEELESAKQWGDSLDALHGWRRLYDFEMQKARLMAQADFERTGPLIESLDNAIRDIQRRLGIDA